MKLWPCFSLTVIHWLSESLLLPRMAYWQALSSTNSQMDPGDHT
jgi:hypothetical protein